MTAIDSIRIRNRALFVELRSIATYAQQRDIDVEWLDRLKNRLRAYERQLRAEKRREQLVTALEAVGLKEPVKRGLRLLGLMK